MSKENTSPDDFKKLLWSFAGHRVITVAGRLGILRLLAERSLTTDNVARELNLDPLATGKMVRALAALGLMTVSDDTYRVCDELAPYFRPGEADLTPFIEHSHSLYDRWGENLEAWTRGKPWKTKQRDPNGVKQFGEAMKAIGVDVAKRVVTALKLTRAKRFLDVGGGLGHFSQAFLEAQENLTATVIDTPEVAALGREKFVGSDLESRIEFKGGHYLNIDWGENYDLTLLGNVLHQEKSQNALEMVRRGARSLKPGGLLAVVDFAIDDEQRRNLIGTLFAINMRSFGDTYTEPTIRSWMRSAGLMDIQRTDLSDYRWLIVGSKPGSRR